eukprot:Nitzschia sp. Nitz4//scaffold107_size73032//53955//55772//NITZ4_005768-RA/size73032-processed-gene-0.130-mRNA-1//-1//CDS//3329532617//4508//frame0
MEVLKHFTPRIYERVLEAMPPVQEWNHFLFGPYMTSPTPMARVQHPVDAPLVANRDANGTLLQGKSPASFPEPNESDLLSDCTVGHLAQHTFHRILFDEVTENLAGSKSTVEFGSRVVGAERSVSDGMWHVTTSQGKNYAAPLVVAADGVRSAWRQDYVKIGMSGQTTIQHLINVHFSLLNEPSKELLPPAMLYTVFSPEVLSMVVRHSPTEYVMQIPYFPPYQTLPDDFSHTQVQRMVQSALEGSTISSGRIPFRINSIRPWTMGSLVANSYAKDNVYLIGDAAHVFPPAGGFGMNTGIQDAAGLAWRIQAMGVEPHKGREECFSRERQSAARNNAALSVRNYQRVLGVMRSIYLDERNLPVVLGGLESSSMVGMPLSWQRTLFQSLYKTALLPLRMLRDAPNSPYTRHVSNNLRRLLGSGQGLPLLFPRHELLFRYPSRDNPDTVDKKQVVPDESDTMANGMQPIKEGLLFPHIPATMDGQRITTRDLPMHLGTKDAPCPMVLIEIVRQDDTSSKSSVVSKADKLTEALKLSVIPVRLCVGSSHKEDSSVIQVHAATNLVEGKLQKEDDTNCQLALVRPDGQIASLSNDVEEMLADAQYVLGL